MTKSVQPICPICGSPMIRISAQWCKCQHCRLYPMSQPSQGEWLNCPRGCAVDYEPVRLVPGQRCPECREVAIL